MYYGPPISFFIVLFGFIIIMKVIKSKDRAQANRTADGFNDYDLRLKKLEERIANIETIVLEQERDRKFSSL